MILKNRPLQGVHDPERSQGFFRIDPASSPVLLRPNDGDILRSDETPLLVWRSDDGIRYEVRFSPTENLDYPRVVFGSDFSLTSEQCVVEENKWSCPLPSDVWILVGDLAREHGGEIRFSVFARDPLDRLAWSSPRRVRIVDPGPGVQEDRKQRVESYTSPVDDDTRIPRGWLPRSRR
jgi:hypothetical protein